MKPTDYSLRHLIEAAAKAPPKPAAPPPLGLETRVLAGWRAATPNDETVPLFAFLRHAMLGAALVLVLSAAWSFIQPGASQFGDEAARLDYHIQMSLNP